MLGWILPDHVTSANMTQWSVSEDCTSACVTLKILLRILKCQHEHLHMTEYNRNSSSAVFLSLQRKAISHSATYFDLWIKTWKNLTSGYAYWWLDMEYSREALRVPLKVNRQTSLCGVYKHHFSQVAFAVVVKSLSHVWLCNLMDCSMPGLSVPHHLPEFTQVHVHWISDASQPGFIVYFNLSCISHFQKLFSWNSY